MPLVTPARLAELQQNAQDVRNICVLAHVDHGKTSLTDALIATNGIISPKLAGKIRYLDSRPDEQLRGITMESSAISLCFSMMRRTQQDEQPRQKDYLINLIDSPGHVDFSSEVSTASRLCDGAVVLVDAVEGVCSQTVTVLRQAWLEHMKPLLVINKIDRLIWELRMSALEAYTHLTRLVEEVNAVLGSFFQGERMEEDLHWRERVEQRVDSSRSNEEHPSSRGAAESQEDRLPNDSQENADNANGLFAEKDDEDLYFAPEHNNIIFSSALDGWAFTERQFATLYEKKLGIKRSVLEKVLWGDFYLDPKTKRVLTSKHLKGRALKPMFVQLVLDNIWAVYESTSGGANGKGDAAMLEKITRSLSITLPPHVLRSKDSRVLLTTIFSSWLPLSTAVLVSVIEQLPSPPAAQKDRLLRLIEASPGAADVSPEVINAMVEFKTDIGSPVVAFVSKMVSVPASELPQNKRKPGTMLSAEEARDLARKKRAELSKVQAASETQNGTLNHLTEVLGNVQIDVGSNTKSEEDISEKKADEEAEELIGFARLYSGTLKIGDLVYVLPPKWSPAQPHANPEPKQVQVTALYLFMGRALESLTSVPAGVVFGIGGLGGHILKSGTICSQLEGGINLAGLSMGTQPIVRVALEPVNPGDLGKMIHGMKLLEQSDPCAQYEVLDSGEHVILTAGELHLERCLKDLRERFAKCEIQVGEPIVPYRESIVKTEEMAPPKNKDLPRGTVVGTTASKQLILRLSVRPLPFQLTEFLNKQTGTIRQIYAEHKAAEDIRHRDDQHDGTEEVDIDVTGNGTSHQADLLNPEDFRKALRDALVGNEDEPDFWTRVIDQIVAFGPRRVGPNVLIDMTEGAVCRKFLQTDEGIAEGLKAESMSPDSLSASDFSDRISYGFQLATAQGPLCNEPLQGVAVLLEEVHLVDTTSSEHMGRLTGEVIRTVRDSIRQGFLDWSPRLLLAMYSCEIQASTEVLGRVYGVITRRRGRILSEALHEGTPFFTITALLPVAESFGFSDEIRKRTSGGASPQLRFCGFENVLDLDPFWVPSTEDELEDLGELADRENVAKRYMDGVRRRKGLLVMGLKRTEGEKARTLKK